MVVKRPVRNTKGLHYAAKEWIRKNPEAYLEYAGKWVVVGAQGVDIADTDEDRLRARAKEIGWLNPFIQLVPGGK